MKHIVVFSPLALADLDRIYFEVYQVSSDRKTADDYIEGLLEKVENKTFFPDSGTPLNFNNILTRYRYVIFKAYIAFYYVDGDKLYVDRILYSKSDYIKKLSLK